MTDAGEPPSQALEPPSQALAGEGQAGEGQAGEGPRHVGAVTRVAAWVLDAVLINVVSIMAGLGAALITSMFQIPKPSQGTWQIVAGVVYVLWYAAYFVTFWSLGGQTPGAQFMQIRLLAPGRPGVAPARALVRWAGMQLAAIPLFAGYLPVLFRRRPFPDWLAHTLVLDAPEMSIALAQLEAIRSEHQAPHQPPPAMSR